MECGAVFTSSGFVSASAAIERIDGDEFVIEVANDAPDGAGAVTVGRRLPIGKHEAAVAEALDAGTASEDVILNILARRREPPRPPPITTTEALTLTHPPLADCARYDALRGAHAAA